MVQRISLNNFENTKQLSDQRPIKSWRASS
jgi:hypothetical protein